ncbi:hypothetical protein BDV59DRAFT_175202 [Aspergillus ambiguus]|uniref:uncharacterized protein n=1 Tax=Aspergillus ambiguus TaxID=176160 RepID=UPI003CCCF2B1
MLPTMQPTTLRTSPSASPWSKVHLSSSPTKPRLSALPRVVLQGRLLTLQLGRLSLPTANSRLLVLENLRTLVAAALNTAAMLVTHGVATSSRLARMTHRSTNT